MHRLVPGTAARVRTFPRLTALVTAGLTGPGLPHPAGPYPAALHPAGPDPAALRPAGPDPAAPRPAGPDPAAPRPAGPDPAAPPHAVPASSDQRRRRGGRYRD